MIIRVTRSGGLAGLRPSQREIDTEQLPAHDNAALRDAIERIAAERPAGPPGDHAPARAGGGGRAGADLTAYTIQVQGDGHESVYHFDDMSITPPIAELLRLLGRLG